MDHAQIAERSFDESIQITNIIWLAASNEGERLPEDLWDDIADEDLQRLFSITLPDSSEAWDEEDFAEYLVLNRINGLLCHCRTPVPVYAHEDGGFTTYSYGYCFTYWVYADSLEKAFEMAVEEGTRLRDRRLETLRAEKLGGSK